MEKRTHIRTEVEKDAESEITGSNLWMAIHNTAAAQLQLFVGELERLAPSPGSLVILSARSVQDQGRKCGALLLSALDVRTHLQLSRLYWTTSVASALDFAEYLLLTFPFSLQEIRTTTDRLFHDPSIFQAHHRFTKAVGERGLLHTLASDQDRLIDYVAPYFFASSFVSGDQEYAVALFLRELRNHQYFHNNHRSIPLLHGKTPLQMLRSFHAISPRSVFDPLDPSFPPRVNAAQTANP